MTRESMDHIDCNGITFTGYDYDLQCWVEDYIVQGGIHQGKDIRNIEGHSRRCPVCGDRWHEYAPLEWWVE